MALPWGGVPELLWFDASDPRYMFRDKSIDVDGEEVDDDQEEALRIGSGDRRPSDVGVAGD
jgi:hypothetical protein